METNDLKHGQISRKNARANTALRTLLHLPIDTRKDCERALCILLAVWWGGTLGCALIATWLGVVYFLLAGALCASATLGAFLAFCDEVEKDKSLD